ncbi:Piso0_001892 [Millerozyma farinosa CBS 7064]|uniref:U3 small nucleolar ribonucleoprotein protein MPP10 n=1 Tax=Pichia sorbitophila (strain ATCC MYA-4447 / BCRC 22081 / CBS 7064 / NBRC 10061 / NRRL Y-12695) TaxID=559304 RepID=G8YLZ3_PICSO|nr:Piso0_001892 [Millerozyma farinosa CBS 7064]
MPEDILKTLSSNPQNVFSLFPSESNQNENYFNKLTKEFLDPLSKDHSILEQIHIDGLDSTQVFGQAKIVLDNVADQLLFSDIPKHASHKGDDINVKQYDEADSEDFSESESDADNINDEEQVENQSDVSEEHDGSDDFSEAGVSEDEEEEEEEDADDKYPDSDDSTENAKNDEESNVDQESGDANDNSEGFNKDAFGLNDGFFDIDKFNEQILDMEKSANADDEEIDYFEDLDEKDDEDDEIAYYEDFFDRPNKQDVSSKQKKDADNKFDLSDNSQSEGEGEDEDEEYNYAISSARKDLFDDDMSEDDDKESQKPVNMSSFEKQQQQIQEEISKLESDLVAEKKWTMKGEVSAKSRPQDSLLEDPEAVDLEFDRASKPVPIVTEDFSESIDDVIRRRIKEEQFDDLPKRYISDLEKHDRRPAFELSQEKSKKTLADIYEEEYNGTEDNTKSEETEKLHSEIGNLFEKVTYMLDSLCSAHYIPKPHQTKTIEIKASDAAEINLEDSQPAVVGSGSTLAPQEIYSLKNKGNENKAANQIQLKSGLSYSKDELSREEKLRLRRANKRKRSKEHKHKAELREQLAKEVPEHKRQKRDTMDTLAAAKNVTVIDKKGKKRDVKGNLKKDALPHESSILKL